MRITVSLDTHAVIAQPTPLRIKAASFAPVEIGFIRGTQMVRLPEDTAIEFGLKAKGKADLELLIYHAGFEAAAGNLYGAAINCATTELHAALGIGDDDTTNDKPSIELSGEIGWTFGGQHFRSQTFPVIAEAPVVSSDAPEPLVPPNYPSPESLLLRGDFPFQMLCPVGNSAAQNGTALLRFYAETKDTTPNDIPLGEQNRVSLLLPPAIYDLGETSLILDSPYIDLVGLGTPESVVIASSGTTLRHQAASSIRNLTLRTSANEALARDASDPAAYFPEDGLAPHLENVRLIADHDGTGAWTMRQRVSFNGRYHRVAAGREAFGGRGKAAIPNQATITVNAIPADHQTIEIPDYYGNIQTFEFSSDEWNTWSNTIPTARMEYPRGTIRLDSVPQEGDTVTVEISWGYPLECMFTSGGGVPGYEIEVVIVPGNTSATAEALRVALHSNGWFQSLQRNGSEIEIIFADSFSNAYSSIDSDSAAISTTFDPGGSHAFTPVELAQEITRVLGSYGFGTKAVGNTVTISQPGNKMEGQTWIDGTYTGLDVTEFSGGADAIVSICSGTISECTFEGPLLSRFEGRLRDVRITSYGEFAAIYVRSGAELENVIIETNLYSLVAHELDETAHITWRRCSFGGYIYYNVNNLAKPLPVAEGGTGATTIYGISTMLGLGNAATKNTGTVSGQVPLIGTGNKLDASIIPISGTKRLYAIASAGDGRMIISNSTAETSLIASPYGIGSLIIPAGSISSGNIIRLTLKGVWTTLDEGQGNLSIRIKNGTDTLAAFLNRELPANIVHQGTVTPPWFEITVLISVRALMNSTVSLFMRLQTAVNGPETLWTSNWNTGDSATLNLNNPVNLDVTAQFSIASPSNKLQVYHGFVEQF